MATIEKIVNCLRNKGLNYTIECCYRRVLDYVQIIITYIYIPYTKFSKCKKLENKEDGIVISLTTFEQRFSTIGLCLKSLLIQKKMPDRIIVWLDPSTKEKMTEEMRGFCKYGVEFRESSIDIKGHKKYYDVIKEFDNSIIITVDDDLIYSPFLVSSLMRNYSKYPNAVSARRVHRITWEEEQMQSYNNWNMEVNCDTPSFNLLAVGCGGILYPPNCFNDRLFDLKCIQELCLTADDLWLKFNEVNNNIPVVYTKCLFKHPITIDNSQVVALNHVNVGENKNDICLTNLRLFFGFKFNDFNREVMKNE